MICILNLSPLGIYMPENARYRMICVTMNIKKK